MNNSLIAFTLFRKYMFVLALPRVKLNEFFNFDGIQYIKIFREIPVLNRYLIFCFLTIYCPQENFTHLR